MWAQLKSVMLVREAIKTGLPLSHKFGKTTLIFTIKIIISSLVNVLTLFSINFAINLMNKSVSFHGKHKIVWVTPNFWTVVFMYFQKCRIMYISLVSFNVVCVYEFFSLWLSWRYRTARPVSRWTLLSSGTDSGPRVALPSRHRAEPARSLRSQCLPALSCRCV